MKSLSCLNSECPLSKDAGAGNIIRYGFYSTNSGRRRRYRCRSCGKTFCSDAGTPYHRLQHRRSTFDEVARLSVEGVNKSAITRVKRIAWNTVARWLERAAHSCRQFNARKIAALSVVELQADEIRTIVGDKEHPIWVFTAIDVWSRLWPSTFVGRRSYRNSLSLFQDVASRMNLDHVPLIITDGFEFYKRVVRRIFGRACLYDQVIKTRRNDRIIKVERRTLIGEPWRFEETLRLRGLFEIEDVLSRTTESHDPTRLDLSFLADAVPRVMRPHQGAEIRSRGQDASFASWVDHPTVDVKGDLPVGDASLVVGETQIRTIDRLRHSR